MTDSFELVREISELEDQLHLFDLPGWQHIVTEATQQLSDITDRVMNQQPNRMTPEEVEQKRGEARKLRWIVELKDKTEEQLALKRRDLSELQDAAQLAE